jgi:hypothetical protein
MVRVVAQKLGEQASTGSVVAQPYRGYRVCEQRLVVHLRWAEESPLDG